MTDKKEQPKPKEQPKGFSTAELDKLADKIGKPIGRIRVL